MLLQKSKLIQKFVNFSVRILLFTGINLFFTITTWRCRQNTCCRWDRRKATSFSSSRRTSLKKCGWKQERRACVCVRNPDNTVVILILIYCISIKAKPPHWKLPNQSLWNQSLPNQSLPEFQLMHPLLHIMKMIKNS